MKINVKNGQAFERLLFGDGIGNFDIKFPPAFVSFRVSLSQVKENQSKIGWQPHKPSTELARLLFQAVQKYLPEEWMLKELRLYIAVGSALDFHHGVDCFFDLCGSIVTIDATLRKSKPHRQCDLVLPKEYFEEEGALEKVGKYIANMLSRRRSKYLIKKRSRPPRKQVKIGFYVRKGHLSAVREARKNGEK